MATIPRNLTALPVLLIDSLIVLASRMKSIWSKAYRLVFESLITSGDANRNPMSNLDVSTTLLGSICYFRTICSSSNLVSYDNLSPLLAANDYVFGNIIVGLKGYSF